MKPLTSLQKDVLIERYCEIVVDRMDINQLQEYVAEDLANRYDNMSDSDLKDYVDSIEQDDIFDQLSNDVRDDYDVEGVTMQEFIPGFHD